MAWVLLPLAGLTVGLSTLAQERPNTRPTDEERGEELYQRHCIQCHGPGAAGDGPAAAALVAPVPSVRDNPGGVVDQVPLVLDGRNAMPGFSQSFDRHDASRVLRHMRRVARARAPTPPAQPADE